MAEAILRGLLKKGVLAPDQIVAADVSAERCHLISSALGIRVVDSNDEVVRTAQVVVLAVKPQVMAEALASSSSLLRENQLIVSIAAGLNTEKLDRLCRGIPAIVRVMPNTPALIGQGVTAICSGPRATDEHLGLVGMLFSAVGSTLRVVEEEMDAVTAISGSGPAYVFYLMEAMMLAGQELGLDSSKTRQLVYGTLIGAAMQAGASEYGPDVLRARVTSPGGTTEAALRHLEAHHADRIITDAVKIAAKRSRDLSS